MEIENSRDSKRERDIYRVTLLGSIGNLLLLVFKFVAGIVGHSSAMIADAVHSLSDFVTDVIVIVFVRIAGKPQDKDHDYGHGKFETLATAVIGLMLLGVGIGIFCNGARNIWDFYHGEKLEAPGMLALWAAIISIVVKEILYRITVRVGRKTDSPTVIANAWHHRSDALSSIGTLVGIGGAILLGSKWVVLDPIAAVIVSLLIIRVAWKLVYHCIGELTEKSLPENVEQQIIDAITGTPQVSQPHNLRTRRIGSRSAVDVHVRVNGNMTVNKSHEITKNLENKIRKILGHNTFVNIHVEPEKNNSENRKGKNPEKR